MKCLSKEAGVLAQPHLPDQALQWSAENPVRRNTKMSDFSATLDMRDLLGGGHAGQSVDGFFFFDTSTSL